jgi:DTW domain-containing protein YfiP
MRASKQPCRDCGAPPRGFHHRGCDIEECPQCGRQLLSCGCLDEPDDEPDDELGGELGTLNDDG